MFREDLYYRLNVFPLSWLPLAQRVDDIFVLAQHLVSLHCQKNGDTVPEFSGAARSKLNAYHWPGNVRELDNVIQRALILYADQVIDAGDLLIENFDTALVVEPEQVTSSEDKLGNELKLQEHQIILDTLQACHGSRKDVAERLGISPRTLRYKIAKMRESGIEIPA
jgi:two-component system response regulator FlrC